MLGAAPTSPRRRMSAMLVALSGAFALAATASAQIHGIEVNTSMLPTLTPAFVRQLKASGVNLFVTAAQRLSTTQRSRVRATAGMTTLTPVPHRKPGLLTTVTQARAACEV